MDFATLNAELRELVAEFGNRPYNFFTILGQPGEPDLDLRIHNERWEFIKSETWHCLDLSQYLLWSGSDNGDLLWWNGEQTIAMDHRSATFISEPVGPRQFIRLVGLDKVGRIFPDSLISN